MRFADTAYFLALLNPRDRWHEIAVALSRNNERLITSTWVLNELAGAITRSRFRAKYVGLVRSLLKAKTVEIVPATNDWFLAGLKLFESRLDKEWSLTDCISFEIMTMRGVRQALTSDRHFEQAGFEMLLKS